MLKARSTDPVAEAQPVSGLSPIHESEGETVRQGLERLLRQSRVEPLIQKIFPDQRRYERLVVPHVVAYLGNAHKSRPYRIVNISAGGFCMLGEDHWTPGTEMPITLQREEWDGDESPERLSVQAIVARCGRGEVGFSVALAPADSVAFSEFPIRHRWISTREMQDFIENLQRPKPPRPYLVDCPRPRTLSLAERTERLLEIAKSYRLSPASELRDADNRR